MNLTASPAALFGLYAALPRAGGLAGVEGGPAEGAAAQGEGFVAAGGGGGGRGGGGAEVEGVFTRDYGSGSVVNMGE